MHQRPLEVPQLLPCGLEILLSDDIRINQYVSNKQASYEYKLILIPERTAYKLNLGTKRPERKLIIVKMYKDSVWKIFAIVHLDTSFAVQIR